MRPLIAAVLLAPSLAIAQPGVAPVQPAPAEMPVVSTTSTEVLGLARGAHIAGVRGDCVAARVLAVRILRLDRDFHDAVISTDPSITKCKPKPRVADLEEPAVPRRTTPRSVVPARDTGRNLGGQVFLGGVMGTGLGFVGLLISMAGEDMETIMAFSGAGVIAGTTAGVVLAGDNAGSDYSLGLTIAGSTLGTIVSWKIVFEGKIDTENRAALIAILVGAPTLGAMLGFNGSRRTLYPSATTQVAVPPAPRISDHTPTVSVLGGEF